MIEDDNNSVMPPTPDPTETLTPTPTVEPMPPTPGPTETSLFSPTPTETPQPTSTEIPSKIPTLVDIDPTPTPTLTFSNKQDYLLLDAINDYMQDYLNQVYFLNLILNQSQKVLQNEHLIRKAFRENDSFIDADAWISCAHEAIERFGPFRPSSTSQTAQDEQ